MRKKVIWGIMACGFEYIHSYKDYGHIGNAYPSDLS